MEGAVLENAESFHDDFRCESPTVLITMGSEAHAPPEFTDWRGGFRDRPPLPLVIAVLRRPFAAPLVSCPDYLFSPGAGRSELYMSATIFQVPSACFAHTVRYFPLSVTVFFPFGADIVSEAVPIV